MRIMADNGSTTRHEGGGESVLQIEPEVGVKTYDWIFRVPPRSRILQLIERLKGKTGPTDFVLSSPISDSEQSPVTVPQQRDVGAVAGAGLLTFGDLNFTTDVFGKIDHSWELRISGFEGSPTTLPANLSITVILLIKDTKDYAVSIRSLEFQMFQGLQLMEKFPMLYASMSIPLPGQKQFVFVANIVQSTWDDTIDSLKVIFNVQCEPATARCITLQASGGWPAVPDLNSIQLKATKFFLSELLSDVVIVCMPGGQKFPAHQVILANESPVFERMFQTEMKEASEGRVKIEGVDPKILKEMLYYIYNGELSGSIALEDACTDIFKVADRYEIKALKTFCFQHMVEMVTFENALEVYDLGYTHGEKIVMEKAVQVMIRDKIEFLKDPKRLRELVNRYPDLAVQLLAK